MAYYRPAVYKDSIYKSPSEKDADEHERKEKQNELRQSYARQIEAQKQRKKMQKMLDRADDLIHLQMEKNYSPWGRGGGGAPLRDATGDVIADLNDVYSGDKSPVNEPLSPNRQRSSILANAGGSALDNSNAEDDMPYSARYRDDPEESGNRYASPYFSPVRTMRDSSGNDFLEQLQQKMEQQHKYTFSSFLNADTGRNGYIDADELAVLCRNYNLPMHNVRTVLKQCDVNGDGKLSYEEFTTKLRNLDSYTGNDTIIAPRPIGRAGGEIIYGAKATGNNLSPKGVLHKGSPIATKMGQKSIILMDSPRSSEQRRRTRQRTKLKADLDSQVQYKESVKRKEQEDKETEELEWQQHLVEKGLDYWGQPIPEGDPRGTARLMAKNTVEKINSSPRAQVMNGKGKRSKKKGRNREGRNGASGQEEGSSPRPFLGALADMIGPSPEEQERRDRTRNRLQNDLASQVREQKLKKFQADYKRQREELESRQKKLDHGLDHWGQQVAAGDPYRVTKKMKREVEVMKKKLNNMRRDFYLQNPEERKEQPSKRASEPSGQSPIKSFEEEFEDFSAKNIREEQSNFEEQTFRQIFSARKPKASEELEETPRNETNYYIKQGSGAGGTQGGEGQEGARDRARGDPGLVWWRHNDMTPRAGRSALAPRSLFA